MTFAENCELMSFAPDRAMMAGQSRVGEEGGKGYTTPVYLSQPASLINLIQQRE